eukprot:13889283-Alexandrium_andersonii.AAC.1
MRSCGFLSGDATAPRTTLNSASVFGGVQGGGTPPGGSALKLLEGAGSHFTRLDVAKSSLKRW